MQRPRGDGGIRIAALDGQACLDTRADCGHPAAPRRRCHVIITFLYCTAPSRNSAGSHFAWIEACVTRYNDMTGRIDMSF